jgi:hypothetical protein
MVSKKKHDSDSPPSEDLELVERQPPIAVRKKSSSGKSVTWSEAEVTRESSLIRQKVSLEEDLDEEEEDEEASARAGAVRKMSSDEWSSHPSDDEDEDEDDTLAAPVAKRDLAKYSVGSSGRRGSLTLSGRPLLRQQSSRYEDRLREELELTQAAFDKYVVTRARDKLAVPTAKQMRVPPEEAYDFFTKAWDDHKTSHVEDRESKKKKKKRRDEEAAEEASDNAADDESDTTKLLVEDVLGSAFVWSLTEEAEAEIIRAKHQMFFVPSTSRVDVKDKLKGDHEPRFVEEEGLYIGEPPKVSKRAKNKLENR